MKGQVTFRGVKPEDYRGICRMIRNEEELFLFHDKARHPFTVVQLEELLHRRKEPEVLLCGGELAGFADFYRYRSGESAFIGNVVIDPAYRGMGLGRRLMQHMMQLAFVNHGLPKLRLHVYARNEGALMLYCRLGFKPYAMKVKTDYRGQPAILLNLSLARPASDPSQALAGAEP